MSSIFEELVAKAGLTLWELPKHKVVKCSHCEVWTDTPVRDKDNNIYCTRCTVYRAQDAQR